MGHVFISYSRRDKEVVESIVAQLEAAGIEVWLDREDIKAGKQWRRQIVESIDTADAFILMLSPNSAASEHLSKELNLAEEALDPFILPVLLTEMKIPDEMRYQLAGTQVIAYHLDPKRGLRELTDQIVKRQGKASERPAVKVPAFREVELILENQTLEKFGKKAQEQFLSLLSEILRGSVVDMGKAFLITRIEKVI